MVNNCKYLNSYDSTSLLFIMNRKHCLLLTELLFIYLFINPNSYLVVYLLYTFFVYLLRCKCLRKGFWWQTNWLHRTCWKAWNITTCKIGSKFTCRNGSANEKAYVQHWINQWEGYVQMGRITCRIGLVNEKTLRANEKGLCVDFICSFIQ